MPQAKELRTALTDVGARFRVVKNTLTKHATNKANTESLKKLLEKPTTFTFITKNNDVTLTTKALAQFRHQNNVLEFKSGTISNKILTIEQIESLARLPNKNQLHKQLINVVASPLTTLVRGLASMISGLAVQLQQ